MKVDAVKWGGGLLAILSLMAGSAWVAWAWQANAYGSRMGNTAPGDGWKYRGRGLIQITGKNNYRACGEALGLDLIAQSELLEKPQHACMSAAWFWASRGLNTLADAGKFDTITARINGGQNGAADRRALYAKALKVLA